MELLFVYNAKADPQSAITDYLHKVFSPSTYGCELCALTHHNLGQRTNWKQFKRKNEQLRMSFYYINQFENKFDESYEYPVVLLRENNSNKVLIAKADFKQMNSANDLILTLENKLRKL